MKAVRSGDRCKHKLLDFLGKGILLRSHMSYYVFTAIDSETEIADVLVVCFFNRPDRLYYIQIAFTRTHARHRKNI